MRTTRFKIRWREFTTAMRNELRYIFTDGGVLLITIGAVFIYSLVYSLAYRPEVLRSVPVAIVDQSNTVSSRELMRALDATPNIRISHREGSLEEAKKRFFEREAYGVIVIPEDFERNLLRGEKINLAVYTDASYFLVYRQVLLDVSSTVLRTGSEIKWVRLVSAGATTQQAQAVSDPVIPHIETLYNPYGGYATFLMPAILIVVIQQTLLVGIGLLGGTWRERKLYRKLIPRGEKRLAVMPLVLGRSAVYLAIHIVLIAYLFGFHYKLFGYPMNGSPGDIVLFLIPYLFSCIFLGIALSTIFKYRENSLIFLLAASIPFLLLSGATLPPEAMPEWLYTLGKLLPSSNAVDGFVRIQTMGATLAEVGMQYRMLWFLTFVYFGLACLGLRRVILKSERERKQEAAKSIHTTNK